MLTLLVLIVLLGLAGLTQGALGFARNVRAARAGGSSRGYAKLLFSVAAGIALAVGTLYVSYPFGVGRIYGFPFPSATANERALIIELRGTLPEVDASKVAPVEPGAFPMQFANMAFAFLLPQLPLRWLFRKPAPAVQRGPLQSRKWVDLLLLVVTGVALAAYVPVVTFIPKASERISSEGRMLLIWPPITMLAAWCVASVWIFDSGLTNRGRWVWLFLLMLSLAGFPASCVYSVLYSSDQPMIP